MSDGTTVGVTVGVKVRQRWAWRLMFPLLLPLFGLLIPFGVHDGSGKEIVFGVVGVLVLAVLTYGAWHGRVLVEPDAIRKRWLRGWGRPMRFDEVTEIELSTSGRSVSTMFIGTHLQTFLVHHEIYPMRTIARALAPQLAARRKQIEVRDTVGTLRRALAALDGR